MGIKSLDELRKLRASLQDKIDLREKGESSENIVEILVGMATCGIAAGARDSYSELLSIIEEKELKNIRVISVGCLGFCSMEPTIQISIPGRESLIYGKMTKDSIKALVQKVIIENGYLEDNLLIKSFERVGV